MCRLGKEYTLGKMICSISHLGVKADQETLCGKVGLWDDGLEENNELNPCAGVLFNYIAIYLCGG